VVEGVGARHVSLARALAKGRTPPRRPLSAGASRSTPPPRPRSAGKGASRNTPLPRPRAAGERVGVRGSDRTSSSHRPK
jgi:hypothetical protein